MELARTGKAKRIHLNAEDCNELGRGPDGTSVLSQTRPLPSTPKRRPHPRTPTKKRKLESPSKQQQSMNDFYQVTGVVSSSPQKGSQQPSSSRPTTGRDGGGTAPPPPAGSRAEPGRSGDPREDDDDDDDDDDDVSLLAALAEEHPETEKGEGEEIDHLEGITSEMFNDTLFECAAARDSTNQKAGVRDLGEEEEEEEEVEPLPDAHYGLLGSSNRGLQEPQGRMEDLPEEVVRLILLLLPAQDLYRRVVLVCHAWRTIVQDPKFVPYKKQYYRYMMGEKDTVAKMKSILEDGGVLDPSLPQESVRRLVLLMSQHASGERLRPEDLMRCVGGHRLFPVAQSCLARRFPDLKQQDPHPYAAMALVLVLSEAVTDVQALVDLLLAAMSRGAVVEFLSHAAALLLAAANNEVKVSSRIHYNIFYVLYLMHSSSTSITTGPNGERYQLTHEQQQILSHRIQPDQVVKIMAFAGTGKTSTLVRYAQQNPRLRCLYVAFNKSVATEAQRRFPGNVDCRTVHSIAYSDVGKSYQLSKKLVPNLKVFSVAKVLPAGRGGFIHGKVVTTALNAFMASADRRIAPHHVPNTFKNTKGLVQTLDAKEKAEYVRDCEEIWRKMKDLNEKSKEGFHMTHDGYLKLWQLKEPKPCLSDSYDVIFIDEAQDCTPAIMDVLLSQRCAKVLVGDPHQQIYTFRGAVNALRTAPHTHLFYLTQSFRFGAEIAFVGATLLQVCKKVQKILVGGNQTGSVFGEDFDPVALVPLSTSPAPRGGAAILSRCNFGVFNEAVRLTDRNPACTLYFVGGVSGIGLSKILDIWTLKQPEHSRTANIKDPFIRSFGSYHGLQAYALQSEDGELEAKLAVVEKHSQRVPELVGRLRACHRDDGSQADFILSTVHKAKGLEFNTVMVCDDFARIPCSRHHLTQLSGFNWWDTPPDEWNLLYVAVTRARSTLILTRNIRNILTQAGVRLPLTPSLSLSVSHSHSLSLSLTLTLCLSLSLSVSHSVSHSLSLTPSLSPSLSLCLSLPHSLSLSLCLSLSLSVSHCFTLSLTHSHLASHSHSVSHSLTHLLRVLCYSSLF
uniref:DNA 3'-5' helicase n=1 Tax=Gadus morhua TaxID=8049 RepID=A0A8C5FMV0_GADMO